MSLRTQEQFDSCLFKPVVLEVVQNRFIINQLEICERIRFSFRSMNEVPQEVLDLGKCTFRQLGTQLYVTLNLHIEFLNGFVKRERIEYVQDVINRNHGEIVTW